MDSTQNSLQPNSQLPAGQNPQSIGASDFFYQQSGVQPTVNQQALVENSPGTGISLNLGAQGGDISSYVQQQAAPPAQNPSKTGPLVGIAIASLLIATILWYVTRKLQK